MSYSSAPNPWEHLGAAGTVIDTIQTYLTSGLPADISSLISGAGVAPINSPAFTGTPTAPTPTSSDNTTKIATTAFVQTTVNARAPKTTVSTMAGGPPGTPADGDIWIARGITTAGGSESVTWQFVYDSANTVWRFIGGPPMIAASTATFQNTVDSTWEYVSGSPSITAPRSGAYMFQIDGIFFGDNGVNQYASVADSTLTNFIDTMLQWNMDNSFSASVLMKGGSTWRGPLTLTGGTAAKYVMQSSAHTNTQISAPAMSCLPFYIT